MQFHTADRAPRHTQPRPPADTPPAHTATRWAVPHVHWQGLRLPSAAGSENTVGKGAVQTKRHKAPQSSQHGRDAESADGRRRQRHWEEPSSRGHRAPHRGLARERARQRRRRRKRRARAVSGARARRGDGAGADGSPTPSTSAPSPGLRKTSDLSSRDPNRVRR